MRSPDLKKRVKVVVKDLRKRGYSVEQERGHFVIRDQGGHRLGTLAHTPSDHRTTLNDLANLRRAGVEVRR